MGENQVKKQDVKKNFFEKMADVIKEEIDKSVEHMTLNIKNSKSGFCVEKDTANIKSLRVPHRLLSGPHLVIVNGQVLTPSTRINGRCQINDYSTYISNEDGEKIGHLHLEGGINHNRNVVIAIQRTDTGERWAWTPKEGVIFDGDLASEIRE